MLCLEGPTGHPEWRLDLDVSVSGLLDSEPGRPRQPGTPAKPDPVDVDPRALTENRWVTLRDVKAVRTGHGVSLVWSDHTDQGALPAQAGLWPTRFGTGRQIHLT